MTSEQIMVAHGVRLALQAAAREAPAVAAMQGIDIGAGGLRHHANGALVAAYMAAYGEPLSFSPIA
jgi:hypothetical protein